MSFSDQEILETLRMVELETLDVRTTTLGINLLDCADPDLESACEKVYTKIIHHGKDLVRTAESIASDYGVPIVNKRIAVTPISLIAGPSGAESLVPLAKAMDAAAEEVGVDFIGGFTAYVHKGFTRADDALFRSIPEALAATKRVCSSVSLGTTKSGINMDAVVRFTDLLLDTAERTKADGGLGCAKLVCFMNPVEDNPFVADAERRLNVLAEICASRYCWLLSRSSLLVPFPATTGTGLHLKTANTGCSLCLRGWPTREGWNIYVLPGEMKSRSCWPR